MNYKTISFIEGHIRKFTTSSIKKKSKNHYESLGISRNATQSDIKSAYYTLSKVYHPDKSQGSTSQRMDNENKFRAITEAYEVLGNIRSRKLYDKGFMTDYHPHHQTTTDPLHKFYKSRETRTRPPPPSGRIPIYNFDEWTKNHYGETFRKKMEMKQRQTFHQQMRDDEKYSDKKERALIFMLAFIVACLIFRELTDYDRPQQKHNSLRTIIFPKDVYRNKTNNGND